MQRQHPLSFEDNAPGSPSQTHESLRCEEGGGAASAAPEGEAEELQALLHELCTRKLTSIINELNWREFPD